MRWFLLVALFLGLFLPSVLHAEQTQEEALKKLEQNSKSSTEVSKVRDQISQALLITIDNLERIIQRQNEKLKKQEILLKNSDRKIAKAENSTQSVQGLFDIYVREQEIKQKIMVGIIIVEAVAVIVLGSKIIFKW